MVKKQKMLCNKMVRENLYKLKRKRKQVNKQRKEETENVSNSAMEIKILRFRICFHRLGD